MATANKYEVEVPEYNGEPLIAEIPKYGGRGGSQQAADFYAANDFKQFFGRLPTRTELAMISAAYMSGDPNIANTSGGRARVAEYYQQEKDKKKPEQEKTKFEDEVKTHLPAAGNLVKSVLGRDATTEEADHFARLKAQGYDDYTIGEALRQLPEFTEKQDATARDKLRGELSSGDQRFFSEDVMPAIQSRFGQQGRSVEGSGFQSALANAAKKLSAERENYLAGVGREDYSYRRQNTIDNYLNNMNRQTQLQDYGRMRADQLTDAYRNRQYELTNYDIERQAYEQYMRNYGKRKNNGLMGAATGATSGAASGAMLGSAVPGLGTAVGAGIGAVVGGGLGYFGSRS